MVQGAHPSHVCDLHETFFFVGLLRTANVVFGVFLVEGTLSYCVQTDAMVDDSTVQLLHFFGTFSDAVLTLNASITGGLDWTEGLQLFSG